MTKINDLYNIINQILKTYKKIDILVNNAGINITKPALEIEESDWDKVLDTNLKSLFFISKFIAKNMIEQSKGKIVNMASQVGFVGYFNRSSYASSKGGVIQLTKTLAIEWADNNINVNAVAPTFVETDLTKNMLQSPEFTEDILNRILFHKMPKADDISNTVLFLSSDLSDFITGETIKVDGGWTAI
jgi:NAD(P)-dependent dehydrogenase (short-subunit alcohol dehydrogenase family)